MMRRKEAMARARKRRKRDIDITAVDDHIMAMIRQMRQAVEVRGHFQFHFVIIGSPVYWDLFSRVMGVLNWDSAIIGIEQVA